MREMSQEERSFAVIDDVALPMRLADVLSYPLFVLSKGQRNNKRRINNPAELRVVLSTFVDITDSNPVFLEPYFDES